MIFILSLVGFVIYKLITCDRERWHEESENMGDDVF